MIEIINLADGNCVILEVGRVIVWRISISYFVIKFLATEHYANIYFHDVLWVIHFDSHLVDISKLVGID